jgi:Tfp pilus assembly protein PilF
MARHFPLFFLRFPGGSRFAKRLLVCFQALIFPVLCGTTGAGAEEPSAAKTGAKIIGIGATDAGEAGRLPDLTRELAQRAAAAVSRKDWKSARAAYREMVDADPGNAPALANLGAVEFQMQEYDAAIGHLERALIARPGLAQTWLTLGMVHYARDQPLRALSALSRAVAEKPDDPRARNHLAAAAKALGWLGAAESELQRALDLDPAYAEAHFNLALIYLERRPPAIELARRHYLRAVELGTPRDEIIEKQLNDPASEEINETDPSVSPPASAPATPPAATPKARPKSASTPKAKPSSSTPTRRSSPER